MKAFPAFDSKRLVEWQDKGFITKLVNKWYAFTDLEKTELMNFRISNCIYQPSYISLESALSFYGLIPETVMQIQAVSTKKTISYDTSAGHFRYRTIKANLFFGYQVMREHELPVLIADKEKALLDYLYLVHQIKTLADFISIRLNADVIKSQLDWIKLMDYAKVFNSRVVDKKIRVVRKLVENADSF